MNNHKHTILLVIIAFAFTNCTSPEHISGAYYLKNKITVNNIEASYKQLYKQKPFALQFTNNAFDIVSIDILTDSIKYVYAFGINENQRMNDTLVKYGISTQGVGALIKQMKQIKCNWINNLDYYVDAVRHNMIFMSIRPLIWSAPFIPPKYYILTYFSTPQYFDAEGRLLDKRRTKRLRKIKGDVFHRINDTVCYTVSSSFR
jgi:hypothetical protein